MLARDPYKEYKRSDQEKKNQQYMHKLQKIRQRTKGFEKTATKYI